MYFEMELKPADRPALQTDTGICITYGELREQIAEFRHAVRRRSFVFLLCENSQGAVIGYLGCLNVGAVPLLLNADLDETVLQDMYERYQPEYVWMPKKKKTVWEPCIFLKKQKRKDETINKKEEKSSEIIFELAEYALYATKASKCELHPELALLLTTSGSTGSPKLVRLSRKNLESNAASIVEYLKLTESERAITCLPMQYTYGLSVLNSHFLAGACVLLTTRSVVQQQFWDYFRSAGGTSLVGVPYTYELFQRLHLFDKQAEAGEQPWYQHLRYMTQAGGRLKEALQQKVGIWAKEHGIDFVVMYGQTEATARMSYLPSEQCLQKIGSIGIAIPGGAFHLEDVDETTGIGELVYEGANVTLGMAENRTDLRKGDERNGILHTGDLARVDEDGYYYIAGRKKRFLKIFGIRIGLDECEHILQKAYEEVDCEFVCVGTDDHLQIYTTDQICAQTAAEFLADRLHISNRAVQAYYIAEIPKNPSGKTQYSKLQGEGGEKLERTKIT